MLSIPFVLFCLFVTAEMEDEDEEIAIETGGWVRQSQFQPHVRELAKGSVEEFNKRINSKFYFVFAGVLNAKSRVTVGVEWALKIRYQMSDCKKGIATDISKCEPKEGGTSKYVIVYALEIPGEDKVAYQF
ncbi:hypothetical protein AB6A40_006136 [Gnathostoma spinigerum]|uniref:Cystatin domain-containing protein n=1 Tax=Gnathostoma spinigerum TaxID=75299 RepID=A0ABD6ERV4_9BILA